MSVEINSLGVQVDTARRKLEAELLAVIRRWESEYELVVIDIDTRQHIAMAPGLSRTAALRVTVQ